MCKKSSDARDASDPFTFLFITSLPPGKQPERQDALSPIQQAMFLEPLARTKQLTAFQWWLEIPPPPHEHLLRTFSDA